MANSHIFLCYTRADEASVSRLYEDLSVAGLKPWMDHRDLLPGDNWDSKIRSAIRSSRSFLVILTPNSIDKRGYLQKEIKQALDIQDEKLEGDRYVIPVRLKPCKIPDRLSHLQCADLFEDGAIERLISVLQESQAPQLDSEFEESNGGPQRSGEISIGGIRTPCFFPSISGAAKNNLSPLEHLEIIVAIKFPIFLVSAFDIYNSTREEHLKINRLLDKASTQGQIILMDSGLYEKKWMHANSWPKKNFYTTLRQIPCHIAFNFDRVDTKLEKLEARELAETIIQSVIKDRQAADFNAIMPIVHTRKPEYLPEICTKIAEDLDPALIAVPERELGSGVLVGASTLVRIRKELNRTRKYYPLHILGAGNPLSILIYAACGADSFDGLDWCQTAADHESGRLYHSLQWDFFAHQTQFGSESHLSYIPRLFAHNLEFYKDWMVAIQEHLIADNIVSMIEKYIPSSIVSEILELLNGGFETPK